MECNRAFPSLSPFDTDTAKDSQLALGSNWKHREHWHESCESTGQYKFTVPMTTQGDFATAFGSTTAPSLHTVALTRLLGLVLVTEIHGLPHGDARQCDTAEKRGITGEQRLPSELVRVHKKSLSCSASPRLEARR